MVKPFFGAVATLLASAAFPSLAVAQKLRVQVSVADGILNGTVDGRLVLIFAPEGVDPLDDTDVTSTPNQFYGLNVNQFSEGSTVVLSGGSNDNTTAGVYGYPEVSLDALAVGTYNVQAFLTKYENAKRSDGSSINIRFPCGDGSANIDGFGSLKTTATDMTVTGGEQTLELTFDQVTPVDAFTGKEIGECAQGNYEDTEFLKYVKIRSEKLSAFWGRDMYVGANVLLPHGYDASNKTHRYPVIYSQGHWPGGRGAFRYPTAAFSQAWENGVIPGDNQTTSAREAPRMILVTVRHEAPYYDDSYAVNTANLGPYGDAINDELIPHIDTVFNTIAEPYARVQEGGSTGGWISIASVIFRPDLFGACFSSYPDSLDFHKHQDIPLYTSKNAYRNEDGSDIGSIREFVDKKEHVLATVRQENHWELVFGTSSRSANQWDVWNAVFGVQGLNGYPLEPWDKITGEIYPEAVEYWKEMDLANYILENWDTERNLGEALRERLFVWVGEWDNYYLNEGVKQFQDRIEAKGGVGWANVTILPEKTHGGNYQAREIWNYLELVYGWIQDHAPDGKTPLSSEVTAPSGRGNIFSDVISVGGREAALARQAPPSIEVEGSIIKGTVGRWDPGVVLEAQWVVDGKPKCGRFKVTPGSELKHKTKAGKSRKVELWVTGSKRGYETETRRSNSVTLE
ncbi:unnamed protein product [Clonostachys rosea f. rosea IK726]|jgi:predicted alpha/beta superfamily hydrolase|uniref:Uncharacterized protein n=1 Tax=Clonostachys rosea f. rosea IK726 TaxID=1349383 RepID=A0ACA9ULT8_BIOOC|nr:unnamed protein product [Clonostachys rosea f. rosea IK726]